MAIASSRASSLAMLLGASPDGFCTLRVFGPPLPPAGATPSRAGLSARRGAKCSGTGRPARTSGEDEGGAGVCDDRIRGRFDPPFGPPLEPPPPPPAPPAAPPPAPRLLANSSLLGLSAPNLPVALDLPL